MKYWTFPGVLSLALFACSPAARNARDASRPGDTATEADRPAPRDASVGSDVFDAAPEQDASVDSTVADTTPPFDAGRPDTSPDTIMALDGSGTDAAPSDGQSVPDVRDVAQMADRTPPPDVIRGSSPLLGTCADDSDCAAPADRCLRSYPSGLCTRACASDTDCPAHGICHIGVGAMTGVCLPRCTVSGGQCNETQYCRALDNTQNRYACLPACYVTPPVGVAACTAPWSCDPYENTCTTTPSNGFDNGAGCTADDQCRSGICREEVRNGSSTGWLGGYCLSYGRMPSVGLYRAGQPIPQSTCPTGSAALPLEPNAAEGDAALCYKRCTDDAQCRNGYECRRYAVPGGGTSSDGVCLRLDCSRMGATCPAGTSCRTVSGGGGVCVR